MLNGSLPVRLLDNWSQCRDHTGLHKVGGGLAAPFITTAHLRRLTLND